MKNRLFSLLLILIITMIQCFDIQANDDRSILVLHSYHRGFAWDDSIDRGISNIFAGHPDVDIRTEYMDTKRIKNEEYYSILLNTYKFKFSGLHFDAVIITDNNALDFLTKHRDELFPDTPIIFCGVNNFDPTMLGEAKGFTGATESIAVQGTLDVALKLDPDVKYVYIFGANTNTYRGNKEKFLQIIPEFEDKLEFVFHDDVDIPQAVEILNNAPHNSIAFVIAFLRNKNGEFVTFEDASNIISKHTNIPLYGLWDYLLGHGVVGGLVISGIAQGETAAQMALDIIDGKPVDKIPFLLTSPNRYIFDYQQLHRFGFDLNKLPEKSTVINLPNSFYSNYKELIWVVISCAIGLLAIIFILILNILYRKKAEEKLRESEEKFRTITENSADAIFIINQQGRYVYVNNTACQLLGYTSKELLEMETSDLRLPEDRDKSKEAVAKIREEGRLTKELEMRRKNGSFVQTDLNAIRLPNGLLYGSCRDITERKQAEALLKSAIESSQDTILASIDKEYRYLYFNQVHVDGMITIYNSNIEVGKSHLGYITNEEDRKNSKINFDKALAGESHTAIQEYGELKRLYLETRFDPIFDESHEIIGATSFGNDITNRIQAEEQIKNSLKEKETLLQEINHRVKNNMSVISSLLKLQANSTDDDRLKDALMVSQNRVQSMSAIHEVLYQSDNLSSIDMNTYLSNLSGAIAQNYTISSKVNIRVESENILIGAKQASPLGLVVNELITNSFKYAFPDNQAGEIIISLQKKEDQIELKYTDNGIGMPKDFDWQTAKSMGLKLVRTLVENQLDGSIDMESNSGTKFTIKFNIET